MEKGNVAADQVIAELIGMGFEFSNVTEAVKAVGPSLDDAVEFILNDSFRKTESAPSSSMSIAGSPKSQGKKISSSLHSSGQLRQSSITEHLQPGGRSKRSKITTKSDVLVPHLQCPPRPMEDLKESPPFVKPNLPGSLGASNIQSNYKDEDEIGSDWEQKVRGILLQHFAYSSLRTFQKEALAAWLSHEDCLVLAATGSGKSLCFQIPALLSGKVVVVISPLISLMHDQCFKLAKRGVSACFLGSGQIDRGVEQKAMSGMYEIIYVCPETVLRLIRPLQSLAESRGIALFAIDEVHCVSKWGHDFRPDYRQLSVLRESFRADNLKNLKFDVPLMALTATATVRIRDDILKSLRMSKDTKIIATSFFRPNLRFSVKHSKTSSASSYEKDFHELIEIYTRKRKSSNSKALEDAPHKVSCTETESMLESGTIDDAEYSEEDDDEGLSSENSRFSSKAKHLSVEYLEDESDLFQDADDLDVSCGEFSRRSSIENSNNLVSPDAYNLLIRPEERLKLQLEPLEEGLTIIYVPTRKETLSISKFLSRFGVKAAAYNAKLPKSHLRQVHKEFHEDALQVVVATVAFGMGIDKLNVRRIIHYGWPQSLEAYYQEAGRAGRDGKLADCVLYANLLRIPSLLPSQRSEEQTKQAYKMLSDCFRYGMRNASCRAKALVEYFGEEFIQEKCFLCDVCIKGPPAMQNLKRQMMVLMQAIAAYYGENKMPGVSFDDAVIQGSVRHGRLQEKPNLKMFVSRIREQHQEFSSSDLIWWRGLSRILEDKGFIREGGDMTRVQIMFPEPTKSGLELLKSEDQPFYVYPEADMMLSTSNHKPYSSFAEWSKGWADPEIRRERLEKKRLWGKPKRRKSRKHQPNVKTVRGRLAAKLSKKR